MTFDALNISAALPELIMICFAFVLIVFGVIGGDKISKTVNNVTVLALVCAGLSVLFSNTVSGTAFNDMFIMDGFAGFLKIIIFIGAIISLIISVPYLTASQTFRFEYPILVLLSVTGMGIMVSANNLLALYLGLELQSLSLYVLATINRNNLRASEAGLKYFILGALSSGLLLFGSSILYGVTGSLGYDTIAAVIQASSSSDPILLIGMVFVLAGLAFKISAVPFHMWTPDVYEGAPTPVTAFFAIAPKVAALGLIARFITIPMGDLLLSWQQILIFLSVTSMTVGAFGALVQDNLKRLLAYSSIGNMGYALIGFVSVSSSGLTAVLVYIAIYMITTAGVFAVILSLNTDKAFPEKISDLSGLSKKMKSKAYMLAIFMFSMAGIPPLAGFLGKWVIFQAAVDAQLFWLAVYGVITSVISAYYYLRIIKVMFFDEPTGDHTKTKEFSIALVQCVCATFVLFFIISPDLVFDPARIAVESLIPAE